MDTPEQKGENTMKKRILATVLAGVAAFSLVGCGGSETAVTTAAQAADSGNKEEAAGGEAAADVETTATDWAPSTTVSIVVPAGAGGNTDLSARVFAQRNLLEMTLLL